MKHHHCHCHFHAQLAKLKAGKLSLLGGIFIVAHLLFHVAECLLLPVIITSFSHHDVEATSELPPEESKETTYISGFVELSTLKISFTDTLAQYALE